MSEYTIRQARPADSSELQTIAADVWNETYADHYHQATIDAALEEWYSEAAVVELIERDDAVYLVAEEDSGLLGYVSGGPTDEAGLAYLGALYVTTDRWGEGIGTALLERFEESCLDAGYEELTFNVASGNDQAAAFYRSHGYEVVDEQATELFGERTTEQVFRGDIG